MLIQMQFPSGAREGECFYREEKEFGRGRINRESMTFHWLSPCQRKGGDFLLLGLAIVRGLRPTPLVSKIDLI